jgi:hypothetical protein
MKRAAPYSLHLSPILWKQVGAMRREDFARLQHALARAQAAGVLHQARANEERGDERRTFTLLQVEDMPGGGS